MDSTSSATVYAQIVMQRAATLGSISEEPGCLVRRFATPAMAEVNHLVEGWMREAGMAARRDNIGNIIGQYEAGRDTQGRASRTLILGSHLDTVRDAGKYDGPLGVLVAIACVQALHDAGRRLPFAIQVAGFADEEGLRYGTAYLGSRAFVGRLDGSRYALLPPSDYLQLTDRDGIMLADAIRDFGGDPASLDGDARGRDDLLGYCEVHIEQGPVLEHEGLPVSIVSAISGQTRARLIFAGRSGHAGTVPMTMRRDALTAAAEFVLAVESLARAVPGMVATVGQLTVEPGASNVIPGGVTLSLDLRHIDDGTRQQAYNRLQTEARAITSRRGIGIDWHFMQDNGSVRCSPQLKASLAAAVEASGLRAIELPSGAGHDAVVMSEICPVAMLFVRCKGGISHNPAESVEVEDVAAAIDVMSRFLESLDAAL